MSSRIATIVLLVGIVFGSVTLVSRLSGYRLPGNQQGYEPEQPIAFSHRLHAGELQIACVYCHTGAEKGRHAGIPAGNVCMNCHRHVTAPAMSVAAEFESAKQEKRDPHPVISPKLKTLYDALGLNEKMQPVSGKPAAGIAWVKVHNLPAYACFDHRAHVAAGVACQRCHGPVETMERVRQVESLSMGWCVNCHRDAGRTGIAGKKAHPSTDCSACHY
jgi:hypothetical protein